MPGPAATCTTLPPSGSVITMSKFPSTPLANVILPAHILKDATAADIQTVPFTVGTPGVTVGTGPYKLTAFTPDQMVELEANPDYFKGAPAIDRIVFKLDFEDWSNGHDRFHLGMGYVF